MSKSPKSPRLVYDASDVDINQLHDAPAADAAPAKNDNAGGGARPQSREAQVALLMRIAGHRYGYYYFPEKGWGVEAKLPLAPTEHINALILADWIYYDPTGGECGSVKVAPLGREVLAADQLEAEALEAADG